MPIKSYSLPDDTQRVNEPVSAYGYDLNAMKVEAIGLLMNIDTPALLRKAIDSLFCLSKEKRDSPIQFTVEELKQELEISMEESRQGLGVEQDEMINRIGRCFSDFPAGRTCRAFVGGNTCSMGLQAESVTVKTTN